MRNFKEIFTHLNDTVYSKRAQRKIRKFLFDKGYIIQCFHYAQRTTEPFSRNFDDFMKWYNDGFEKIANTISKQRGDILSAINDNIHFRELSDVPIDPSCSPTFKYLMTLHRKRRNGINVGDCVKVYGSGEPHTEYVEGIGNVDGDTVYLLSDGTWGKECGISPYEVQGDERKALIDKLNKLKEE